MTSKEIWGTAELRQSSVQVISTLVSSLPGTEKLDVKILEDEIFNRSKSQEDYEKLLVKLNTNIKAKFNQSACKSEVKPGYLLSENEIKTEPQNEKVLEIKREILSELPEPAPKPESEVSNPDYSKRIKKCQILLQHILNEGPSAKYSNEYIENCRRMQKIFPHFRDYNGTDEHLRLIGRCEAFLMEKFGELDEIDLKILEIKCGKSQETPVSQAPARPRNSCDSIEAIKNLKIIDTPMNIPQINTNNMNPQPTVNISTVISTNGSSANSNFIRSNSEPMSTSSIQLPMQQLNSNAIPGTNASPCQLQNASNVTPTSINNSTALKTQDKQNLINMFIAKNNSVNAVSQAKIHAPVYQVMSKSTEQNSSYNVPNQVVNSPSNNAQTMAHMNSPPNQSMRLERSQSFNHPIQENQNQLNRSNSESNFERLLQQHVARVFNYHNMTKTTPAQPVNQQQRDQNVFRQPLPVAAQNVQNVAINSLNGPLRSQQFAPRGVFNSPNRMVANQNQNKNIQRPPAYNQNRGSPGTSGGHQQMRPQLQQNSVNMNDKQFWRPGAQESLQKIVLEMEAMVFAHVTNKDQYMKFFQSLFEYASGKLNGQSENQNSLAKNYTGTSFEEMKNLLSNEPPSIQERTMMEWCDIDCRVNNLLKSFRDSVDGPDQNYDKINLQPDEFEQSLSTFLNQIKWKND